MNTKNRNILIVLGIAIFLLGGLFLLFNKSHAYHELPKVKLKDDNNNVKQFALMVEQNKGTGDYQDKSEEYASAFPTEGFRLNADMSGCTDINGKTIENAIEYDYDNYTITVNTNKTAYCYLYYDIYEKPTAPGTQLEGKDGLTKDLVGGMYRYQGTNDVPNWIIFGTKEECNKDEEEKCTNEKLGEMTYAEYVDKYMYRIIGITPEGQMYLLKEAFLKEGEVTRFSWNHEDLISGSATTYLCPDGNCPEWNEADLFQRINGKANGTSAGAGGTSGEADTDIFVDSTYYDYLKSGDNVNGGEGASEWYKLIADHKWMYGDTTENTNSNKYNGNYMYNIETGDAENGETTHYVKGEDGTVTSQNYTWKNTDKVEAKISLMYIHDVDYAYPEGVPGSRSNVASSWIHFQKDGYNSSAAAEWLSTRWGISSASSARVTAWHLNNYGDFNGYYADSNLDNGYGVRPVFYLTSEAKITGGEGTKSSPYILLN